MAVGANPCSLPLSCLPLAAKSQWLGCVLEVPGRIPGMGIQPQLDLHTPGLLPGTGQLSLAMC